MPIKSGKKTPQEQEFIKRYAATGDREYSAHKAGYAPPLSAAAAKALSRPVVREEIRRTQLARLNNELLPMAIDTLQSILETKTSTERGRLAAVAQVLKYTAGAGVDAGDEKEPYQMTSAELQQRIDALRREAAERARPVIEGEAFEVDEADESGVFG